MKSLTILLLGLVMFVGLARPAPAQTQGLEVTVTVLGEARPVTGAPSEHLLTFSAPVGIPGVGLAPGAYIFRFLTPSVIQVLNEERSMVYAMFFVTPARRSEEANDLAVTLRRIRLDAPPRVATLFLPGASVGYELMSRKSQMASEQIAMR